MRFSPLARRITAPALNLTLGLALAATAAACSSSATPSASGSGSNVPAASSTAGSGSGSPAAPSSAAASSPSTGSNTAAVAQITANWEKFFSSSTPVAQKAALLQNGSAFATAIKDFANFPLASSIAAKVTNVTVTSATAATVSYDVTTSSGSSLLSGQKGVAVYQGGMWKVGDASLCGLLKLVPGSTAPAACNSVG